MKNLLFFFLAICLMACDPKTNSEPVGSGVNLPDTLSYEVLTFEKVLPDCTPIPDSIYCTTASQQLVQLVGGNDQAVLQKINQSIQDSIKGEYVSIEAGLIVKMKASRLGKEFGFSIFAEHTISISSILICRIPFRLKNDSLRVG